MNTNIISTLTVFSYCLATIALALHLSGKRSFPRLIFITGGLITTALHGYLLYRWIDTPFGQNLSLSTMFSLVSWLISVATLLSSLYKPLENLLILTLPLAALSVPVVVFFPGSDYFQTGLYPLRLTHILISIGAFGSLGMAALQASLLYLQTQWIRKKNPESPMRFLPPLQTMESLLFQMTWIGFLFLSGSLASACIFLDDVFTVTRFQKIFFSFVAWTFFAILLYGHHRSGWRGTTAVRWTLSGVIFLIVAYFSSKLLVLKYWSG